MRILVVDDHRDSVESLAWLPGQRGFGDDVCFDHVAFRRTTGGEVH